MKASDSYDFVVIGAGAAGCVLANRLSASGRRSVLLLEAGGKDSSPWIHIPLGYGKHFTNPAVNWLYSSEPQAGAANRRILQPRGKVLGGSTRSEEHTSELQSQSNLVCRLLLEKKKVS